MTGTSLLLGLQISASGAYSASASTPSSILAGQGGSGTFVLTGVVVGGVGPFTYLWSAAGTSGGAWTTGGTTLVYNAGVSGVSGSGGEGNASYTLTVTDTGAANKKTASNTLSLTFINLSGGFPF